jgi:uncharacterized Tic20 family protein
MADEQAPPLPPPAPNAVPGSSGFAPDLQAAAATPEDRSMAMIAHILGALTGVLGPLILYLVKRDQASRFLKFHIMQALWYQVAIMVAYIGLGILTVLAMLVTMGFAGCVCMPILLLAALGELVYSIYGGIQVNNSKDFEYKWIGPWVRKSA